MRELALGFAGSLAIGVTSAALAQMTPGSVAERQAYDRIAAECRLPASSFELIGSDQLRLRPPQNVSHESLDCAIERIELHNLPLRNLGFVGNEARASAGSSAPEEPDDHVVAGWSIDAPARPRDDSFVRFIISGPISAVNEFAQEAAADGWTVEARAAAPGGLVFVQFRVPYQSGGPTSFMDRFISENPRRLNIAGVPVKAEIP